MRCSSAPRRGTCPAWSRSAPGCRAALARLPSTLHDDVGNVAVAGVSRAAGRPGPGLIRQDGVGADREGAGPRTAAGPRAAGRRSAAAGPARSGAPRSGRRREQDRVAGRAPAGVISSMLIASMPTRRRPPRPATGRPAGQIGRVRPVRRRCRSAGPSRCAAAPPRRPRRAGRTQPRRPPGAVPAAYHDRRQVGDRGRAAPRPGRRRPAKRWDGLSMYVPVLPIMSIGPSRTRCPARTAPGTPPGSATARSPGRAARAA